jgi:hypothetical protein
MTMQKSEWRNGRDRFLVRRKRGNLALALGLGLCLGSCSKSEKSEPVQDADPAGATLDVAQADDTDRRISVDTGSTPEVRGDATNPDQRTATVTCIGFWTLNATSDRTGTGTCTVTVTDTDPDDGH